MKAPKKYCIVRQHYDSNGYDTLDEATAEARRYSWETGYEIGIYSLIATASSQELVNTVKVTNVQSS